MTLNQSSDSQTELFYQKIINILERHVKTPGAHTTLIKDLKLFRKETPRQACACFYQPSISLLCQGTKQIIVDKNIFPYDKHHLLITSLDIPTNSQIMEASPIKPCFGISLNLERNIIAELSTQIDLRNSNKTKCSSVSICSVNVSFLEPMYRLLSLMDEPETIPVLAPLVIREIYYRLLTSDAAPILLQIITTGNTGSNIRKAIEWLKQNYSQPLKISHLASAVNMSPSSLHHHFRQLTGKSPLQYQKWLRVHEAKRLMINNNLNAATASYQVGYESPSHFSHDYKAIFGKSPQKDIKNFNQI